MRGLAYCHQKGIIHGDIKPEHLLIESSFKKGENLATVNNSFFSQSLEKIENDDYRDITIKIGDFSIAGINRQGTKLNFSGTDSIMYRAPELLEEADIDIPRALDVWSCGVILYEMLYGYHPFLDDHSNVKIDQILFDELNFSQIIPVTDE